MTDVFARLAPGKTVAQAEHELAEIGTRVRADHPEDYEAAAGYQIHVTQLRDALTGRAKKTLYLLMATAALVLITACANVANLVLTRSIRRERELMHVDDSVRSRLRARGSTYRPSKRPNRRRHRAPRVPRR